MLLSEKSNDSEKYQGEREEKKRERVSRVSRGCHFSKRQDVFLAIFYKNRDQRFSVDFTETS